MRQPRPMVHTAWKPLPGAAISKRLAREGAAVALTYVSTAAKAAAMAGEIVAAGGKATSIQADSADADALRRAVRQAADRFGKLDILVNNAGALAWGAIEEPPLADLDHTLAVNVRSVFIASQEAARHMNDGGRIINIGSTNADRMPDEFFGDSEVYFL
ncbi:SDR family NAD(P)-dependent oxidoreductase, partial [Chromobacterium sphagni]|uniref:SDR family NAD(P)-dependent oxidoreductase n=1 Tax=Chromobacterium sphagni TaxID=1903179 RepID=UPI000AB7AD1F